MLARDHDMCLKRKVKEAIKIKVRKLVLDCDQGYEIPPIYDELLLSCDF